MNAIIQTIVFLLLPLPSYLYSTEAFPYPGIAPKAAKIWQPVNARLFLSETGLRVLSIIDKPRPSMTIDDVKKDGAFTAKVSLRITNPGSVGIVWMESTNGGKPKRRIVFKKLKKKSDHYQTVTLKVPLKGEASTFELLTPWGDSTIKSISFSGGGGDNKWIFVDPNQN
jgi:hypothetical protein